LIAPLGLKTKVRVYIAQQFSSISNSINQQLGQTIELPTGVALEVKTVQMNANPALIRVLIEASKHIVDHHLNRP